MAMYKSTQTHPKFTFYFLAVLRADLCAKPCRQSITATDEHTARKMLVAEYVLFFAGRIPAEGVNHG
nr:host cell division inhibitor Icd-like protein [Providencia rettgeri]